MKIIIEITENKSRSHCGKKEYSEKKLPVQYHSKVLFINPGANGAGESIFYSAKKAL
jgi:hypothetical protein